MTYNSWINITPDTVNLSVEGNADLEIIESICGLLGERKILNYLTQQKRRYRVHVYLTYSPQLDPDEVANEYP